MARRTPTTGVHERRRRASTRALLAAGHALGLVVLPLAHRRAARRAAHLGGAAEIVRHDASLRTVRVLAALATLGALSAVGVGVALGLLSAQDVGGTNTLTAGTVALGAPSTVQTCHATLAYPGTSSASPCTFQVTYTGESTSNAYLAVDVLVVGGSTTEGALWTSLSTGLQLTLSTSGGTSTFALPTSTLANCTAQSKAGGAVGSQFGTSGTGGKVCGEVTDDLLSARTVAPGTSFALHLTWTLPVTSPTNAQTATASVFVVFHAVQSGGGNALPAGCTAIGAVCAPTSSFHWS